MKQKFTRRLRNWFIAGAMVLLPLVGTIYILKLGFEALDSFSGGVLRRYLPVHVPGVGAVATLALIIITGMVATNLIGRRLLAFGERIVARIPLVRSVYSTLKQVVDALGAQNRGAFRHVVLVEYPRPGMYRIGFLTGDGTPETDELAGEETVTVLLSNTPNPATGMMFVLPRKDVIPLALSIEDGLKWVISGGVVTPAAANSAAENGSFQAKQEGEAGHGSGGSDTRQDRG